MIDSTQINDSKPKEIKGFLLLIIRVVAALVFLCVFYILSLKLPVVQNWTKNQILQYINSSYQQNIQINKFYFDPIAGFTAEVFIPDHHQDTLFYADKIQIGLFKSLVTLYQNSLSIKDVKINSLITKVIKYPCEDTSNLDLFISKFHTGGSSNPMLFDIKTLTLLNTKIYYRNETYDAEIRFDKLRATLDSVNSLLDYYKFRKILVDNPRIDLVKLSPDEIINANNLTSTEDSCKENFGIAIDFLNINSGALNIIYEKDKSYKYYNFNNVFLSAFLIYISGDIAQFDFLHLNAKTNDDFVLKNAVVNQFKLNQHILFFNKIKVETGRSNIEMKFQLNSDDPYNGDFSNAFLRAQISKSLMDPKDISYFLPNWNLYNFIRTKTELPFYLKGEIYGKLENLKGKDITFKFEDNLAFHGNIQTRNLFIKNKALINLKINQLTTKASFIRKLLPDFTVPDAYDKFGNIIFSGNYDGYFHDFVAYGLFNTDLGILKSDIKLKLSPEENTALYSGTFETINLKIGELIGDSDLGKISMRTKILNGKGLSKSNVFLNLETSVSSIDYKKYHYKDLKFKGTVNKDLFIGEFKIQDENADLIINGSVGRLNDKYRVKVNSKISKLNFKALHISDDSLSYSGNFNCNLEGSSEDNLVGHFISQNTKLTVNNNILKIDNFRLEQAINQNIRKIKLNSDFIVLEIEGAFKFQSLKQDMFSFLSKKYPGISTALNLPLSDHISKTSAKGFIYIKDGYLLSSIFKLPVIFDKADCDFSFNADMQILDIASNRFDLIYKDFLISKMSFSVLSTENLKLIVTSDFLSNDDAKLTGNFKFSSNYSGQIGQSNLQLFDSTNTKIVSNILSNFSYTTDTFKMSLLNKDLFINKARWKVHENNGLVISRNSFQIQNMELTDNTHYLSIQDNNSNGLILKSDGFDISFVNRFIHNNSIAFYGLFSAEITLPDLKTFSGSTGKINIFQLNFNQDNFGPFNFDIAVSDYNEPWNVIVENIFQEHIIKGHGTINIPIKTKTYKHKPYDFNLDMKLTKFPMSFLDNFISGISNTTGSANGNLNFYSIDHDLFLKGDIIVNESRFHIDYLGAPVFVQNQPVKFIENTIIFNKLTLQDSIGNTISLNGNLNHTNFKMFSADVRLLSPKTLLLNTKKGDNPSYYGLGIGSIDAKFNGLFGTMDLDIILNLQKGTKINIPVETNNTTSDLQFIRFVNKNPVHNAQVENRSMIESISGLNLNAQITFTEDAEISVIFDEQAGDIMKGFGRGNLIIISLRNGLFTVNGNYEIEEGQYLFTLYNFVNKPFTLKRGGMITWTGDAVNANINLEAVYEGLNTSVLPLISEYITIDDRNELKQQRTEVKVRMLLTGLLLQPTIKFDIDLPELTGNIKNYADTKLRYLRSNEDQLNQQIFGLLVLGSFINTNNSGSVIGNIQATGINTISEMLFNQASLFVSNILSNAFNDVNFISGIDVNIGYDLNKETIGSAGINDGEVVLSVKPRLWNDQLIVTLGGNYKSKSSSSLYGNSNFNPESVIEWNTPVRGLKLRVYYKGDESIEGIKHKIGAGVNYRKEYDSFLDFEGELKQLAEKIKNKKNAKKNI